MRAAALLPLAVVLKMCESMAAEKNARDVCVMRGGLPMKRTTLYIIILALFGGVLFFSYLGGWDLWNPDEPRYAQVAKEMLLGEGWIIQHLNSAVYYDKPPFLFWLIAGAAKEIGAMNETAARLPSAFFGLLTLILVFFFGKRLFNERTGLFSALVLATAGEFFWLARRADLDITLTFCTTLAILLFYVGFQQKEGRYLYYLIAYGAMAVGFFTKLYPALIVPFFAVGGYFLWQRRLRFFLDAAHLPGIALFVAMIGGWLYFAYLKGGTDYLLGLLFQKTASTFFVTFGHRESFFYYFWNFPADFLPWTLFVPSAIIYGLKAKNKKDSIFLLLWFALVFLFFSLAQAKRELYIVPIYPAAALIVGKFWADLGSKKQGDSRLLSWPLFLMLAILFVTGAAAPFMVPRFGHQYLSHALEIGLVTAAIFGGGSLLAYFSYRSNRKAFIFFIIVSMMFAFGLYGAFRVFPEINRYKSARPLSQEVVKMMGPDDRLGVFGIEGADYNYYTNYNRMIRFEDEEALKIALCSLTRVFCILEEKSYDELKQDQTIRIYVTAQGQVGHRRLVVISNRPSG
jgi:4-amino-4-deoxy-L-arabinose transferase-like glycosyltransferase